MASILTAQKCTTSILTAQKCMASILTAHCTKVHGLDPCCLQATLMMPDVGLGGGVVGSSERGISQLSLEPGTERVVCYIKFGPVFILNTRLAKVRLIW